MNNPLFLSFIIIGLFVYSTFNLYQSLSIEDGDSSSQLNDNQESDNDFFNSLSRTLPSIDEVPSDENEELDNEGGIFNNFNTEESSKEEGGSSSKKTESNKEKEGITESLNNGFSDSNQETEIINEKGSSDDIEMSSSNEDNNNKDNDNKDNDNNDNDNIDNTEKIEIK